jgi:hypothetical protein
MEIKPGEIGEGRAGIDGNPVKARRFHRSGELSEALGVGHVLFLLRR